LLQGIIEENDPESMKSTQQTNTEQPVSLAKSLAILSEESLTQDKRRPLSRTEHKRLLELRIKKRVKAQYQNGKFNNIMENVVANADTLRDAYDIICLNSNVDLESKREYPCFSSLSEELRNGDFDFKENVTKFVAKTKMKESLVLPRVKLRIVQEAIRISLEVAFRPHFSKISHGCRSGRGHQSALKFISKEIGVPDSYFTIPLNKEVDRNILSKLICEIEEKIDDSHLVSFILAMFEAKVLNVTFGCFPKGHGLPQEGILSPILMNIYLDAFDRELFRISMNYEALNLSRKDSINNHGLNLRAWFRSQIKDKNEKLNLGMETGATTKLYACRFMDEIFVAVFGSEEVVQSISSEIADFLNNSLYLDVKHAVNLIEVREKSHGLQFAGTVVRIATKSASKVRPVHKLKDKVRLFASQKEEIWDSMNLRIGKKWLAYGLRRVKESEIKSLGLSSPLLDQISQYRKEGMKTDHWYKTLLKVWLQDANVKDEPSEVVLLSKYIAEPALPQDLRDAFYDFQKKATEFVLSEEEATLGLLSDFQKIKEELVIRVEAPLHYIKTSLNLYGLVNLEGYARHVPALLLQDDDLIFSWFSGLVHRWVQWYSQFDNFEEIKVLIAYTVRKSCIRTLAAKYRMYEVLVEKKFEKFLDFDTDIEMKQTANVPIHDESLLYGISYSGLCALNLSRVKVPIRVSRNFKCFVIGCPIESPSIYALCVKEKQRFPGWKTGFAPSIHWSLNGKRVGICNKHVKDLYLGNISLQSVEFGAFNR
jgi:retron-type reverse transcriptase